MQKIFRYIIPLMCISAAITAACASGKKDGKDNSLSKKEIFNDLYPKFFVFRGEYDNVVNSSYKNFILSGADGAGYIQKYVPYDELYKIDSLKGSGYASAYLDRNPEKMVLLHWDAEEHVNMMEKSSSKYFPGHWATLRASYLTRDCLPEDDKIYVADIDYFTSKTKNVKARSRWEYPVLLLVSLNQDNHPDWDNYEYVAVDDVNETESYLLVRRGHALSKASAFRKGSRIAPILTYLSSEHLFMFNYSTKCPRDKNGDNAADVQLKELISLFNPQKGLLRKLDGISFDVLNWDPPVTNAALLDSDSDGIGDGAIDPETGENLWRAGAFDFQQRLRRHFGDDFILINDGYNYKDQKALGIFNGIESEGLVKHNDAFRGFSKTMNVFSYWNLRNPLKYKLKTVVPKVNNPIDMPHKEQYVRLCMATSTCLEAALNIAPRRPEEELPDELDCGSEHKLYWLGSPDGEIVFMDECNPDLLEGRYSSGNGFDLNFISDNCHLETERNILSARGKDQNRKDFYCSIRTKTITVPENVNDIVISFSIKSKDGIDGLTPEIPRYVRVKAEGLPVYENNPRNNEMYNTMWGLFDNKGYVSQSFLYRNVAGCELTFVIEAEGPGEFQMKDFRMISSSGTFYRKFENGLILVNPSLHEYSFDMNQIDKNAGYRRIQGNSSVNDGSEVRSSITLGPADAIFLVKTK
ncbi:MAG: hypothetical protein ACI3ZC_08415 [Candidatus Cryptobacteroides sp.]